METNVNSNGSQPPIKRRAGNFRRATALAIKYNNSTGLDYIVIRNPIRSGYDVCPEKNVNIPHTVLFAVRKKSA